MKINTHGLKITGLRKIASESKNLDGYYSGRYIQVNYDPTTGEAWGDYHFSLGQNSRSVYHDSSVIVCGDISSPHTMQQLADLIYRRVGEVFAPEKTYYFANPEHADCIYGSQDPICIDINEVKNLAIGWDITVEDLLDQMHEASEAEIAKWGVYEG